MIPGGRDVKIFTGTMDKDTEGRYLGASNYRNLLNARSGINSEGSFGAIEDVMGNVLVDNPFLANGRNKVIGSYEDIAGQSCIYFVWNEFGFHGIFRWFSNRAGFPNGVIEKIYQVASPTSYDVFNPNPLNFQENSLIVGVNLVDNLLYWTDGFNEPKYINILRANNTNKKFTFELYLNDLSFDTDTTYTVDIYIDNIVSETITWTSTAATSNTYQSRLNDAFIALFSSTTITPSIKGYFIFIEATNVGDYKILISDTSVNQSVVYPENFYPDFPSYSALSYQLLTKIKYPPYCAIEAEFVNETRVPSYFINSPNFTLGGGTWVNSSLGNPNGYYNYTNENLSFQLKITFNIISFNPGDSFAIEMFAATPSSQIYSYNGGPGNIVTVTLNWTVPANSGPDPFLSWFIFLTGCSVQVIGGDYECVDLSTGNTLWRVGVTQSPIIPASGNIGFWPGFDLIGGNTSVNLTRQSLRSTTPLYRAKYVYYDTQHSVYSAISSIILPNDFDSNQYIEINFGDKRLLTTETACDIKNVVIAQSIDDGTTWNDILDFERYEWAGQNKQIYYYDGNTTSIPVDPAEAILQFHSVPLKTKSQEYIGERLFDGEITEGYDKPNVEASVEVKYIPLNDPIIVNQRQKNPFTSIALWKRGYSGKIGIVYYDDADRKCGVCTWIENAINIPPYNYDTTLGFNPAYLTLSIFSDPPAWATKYQVVRTKDTQQTKYLIYNTNGYKYVDQFGNPPGPPGDIKYLILDLSQIGYVSEYPEAGDKISFTYTDGDRIKFICDNDGNFYPDNDVLISKVVGDEVWVESTQIPVLFIPPPNGTTRSIMFEIYSPNKKNEPQNEFYYEFGECHEIKTTTIGGRLKKYHAGNVQDQDLFFDTPAILDLKKGNVYYRNNNFYFGYTPPAPPNIPAVFTQYISSQQPYIKNENDFYGNGRPNITSLSGQTTLNSFRFSDVNLRNKNNLSAYQPLNVLSFDAVYGSLNKMQVVNNDVLKLIFGNSYQISIYVNQGVIRQTQGASNLISLSDEVAGNSHIIQRTLGTINGESVVVNDEGDMFGYDENEGVVWISSGNGLIQISDRGMKAIFKRYSNERKATGGKSETPCVYDLYHDEYIITLNDLPGFVGVTVAYNKQKQGWTSYYSFVPEYYGRVRDYIVSFKNGQLWKHDANTVAKNFYGVQYNRELTYISNKDFPKVKDFKAMSVNGIGQNDAPTIRIAPFQGYPQGMLSSLSKRFFQLLEGIQYAYFQKDKLTPGFGGNQLQALANGRNLKGQTIEVTLINTDTVKSSIYSSDIVYFYSEHS